MKSAAQRGWIELRIVLDPAPYHGPNSLREFIQTKIGATLHPPATHVLTHRLGGLVADRRGKAGEQSAVAVFRAPGPKRITQEIERLLRVTATPVGVLATAPGDEMHTNVTSYEAQTKLAELLRSVVAGNSYTITVQGEPVADLLPTAASKEACCSTAIDQMKEFMRGAPAGTGTDWKGLIDEGRD